MNETMQAIVGELDSAHERAKDAFCRKDAASYMAMFTADLSYRQSDGKVIGRDQLAKDVTAQLSMLYSAQTSFVREGVDIAGNEATERLRQVAEVITKHFKIVYRTEAGTAGEIRLDTNSQWLAD
jgi:Domain of unknown function (DUF4440)